MMFGGTEPLDLVQMKIKNKTFARFGIILIVSFLAAAVSIPATYAGPPLQDPRPPQNGGGGSGGTGGGSGGGQSGGTGGDDNPECASLVGQMINWGFGGEGGVTAELKTGSWQLSTVSATDGNYGFGGLGIGVAVLHVAFTPEQEARFRPLIRDAGVYLNCEYPLIANLALANNIIIEPPVTIEMSASQTVLQPGQNVDIILTINNGLPNEITNVVVTDLFAPGLIPVDVVADVAPGAIKIVDGNENGQLVAINLDKVARGVQVRLRIRVAAGARLTNTTQINNAATLFYRESVAHQASLDFTIREGVSIPVPLVATAITAPIADTTPEADSLVLPTPESTPSVEPSQAITATTTISLTATNEAEDGEDFVPPNDLPTTGEDFVPPPDLLPVTGQIPAQIPTQLSNTGLNPLLPLSGLGIAGLIFIIYQSHAAFKRNKRRKKKELNKTFRS